MTAPIEDVASPPGKTVSDHEQHKVGEIKRDLEIRTDDASYANPVPEGDELPQKVSND